MNADKKIIILIAVITGCFFHAAALDISGVKVFSSFSGKYLDRITALDTPSGGKKFIISDLSYSGREAVLYRPADLLFSFNGPADKMLRDDTGNYRVTSASYIADSIEGSSGQGSARFFAREHVVRLQTEKSQWLGREGDLGSFTIEFKIMPLEFRTESIIFSRTGFLSGEKNGIEIVLSRDRLISRLHGIFEKPDGYKNSYTLKKIIPLKKNIWHHYALSYDRKTGRLSAHLNGAEQESRFITVNGDAFSQPLPPSFCRKKQSGFIECPDLPEARLGSSFSGVLDEFRIIEAPFSELRENSAVAETLYKGVSTEGGIPRNNEGIISSPVNAFENTGTKITLIKWLENLNPDTFIWMEFRIADHLFSEDDSRVKWYRIKNGQKNIYLQPGPDGLPLTGKYYQWKAHLAASPDGRYSPEFYSLEIHYTHDTPPAPPEFLDTVSAGDREITLRWKKNADPDIHSYRIYYGLKEGKYDGVITVSGGNLITNDYSPGAFIMFKIDNQVIEENRIVPAYRHLEYPLLNNSVLYYFSVTACDSYRHGTPFNHESGFSNQAKARPFAGSEIGE